MGAVRGVIAALVLLVGIVGPALALDGDEAGLVVGIMEQLAAQSGDGVYHGGADDMLAADDSGVIAAAGFSAERWRLAYDAVVTGYMATIPGERFDALFAEPLAQLEASTSLSAEQKAAIRAEMEPQIAKAKAARLAGRAHADVVRPLVGRLGVLFFGE